MSSEPRIIRAPRGPQLRARSWLTEAPLRSSRALEAVLRSLRARVPRLGDDRFMAPDIAAARELVLSGVFRTLIDPQALPC